MKIGIISPSKLSYIEEINKNYIADIKKIVSIVVKKKFEIVITPDKGSVSELFAKEYLNMNGQKVYEVVPLDDKEFGLSWVNLELGEHINCGTWRNQPEKLNEETDALLCIGYSVGGLAEIAYTKWFKKKPIYIIKEFISQELPLEINKSLDLRYVSVFELEKVLK